MGATSPTASMTKLIDFSGEAPDFPELQRNESALWVGSVPNFCPRCEEIRGNIDGGTNMGRSVQALMWKSFGMCSECYMFQRDHPEDAKKNQQLFAERRAAKERAAIEAVEARRFRVYFLEVNERVRNTDFVNSICPIKFAKYPDFHKRGLATKAKELVDEQRANEIVQLIKSKGIESWFEKESL